MNLKELTKKQKQYIVLGALGVVSAVALAVFAIRINLSSVSQARDELFDLKDKIKRADSAISKSNTTSEEYERTVSLLKEYLKKLPPERNHYAWATEVLYNVGRSSGLDIDSVDEVAELHVKVTDADKEIGFQAYSLRIRGRGGFAHIKLFLKQMAEKYPLARVTGVEINAGSGLEVHEVQLFVQWPFNLGEIEDLWDEIEATQKEVAKQASEARKSASAKSADQLKKISSETRPSDVSRLAQHTERQGSPSGIIL